MTEVYTLSMTLTSAPLATSICRHSMLLRAAAQCSGVSSSCQSRHNLTVMHHLMTSTNKMEMHTITQNTC